MVGEAVLEVLNEVGDGAAVVSAVAAKTTLCVAMFPAFLSAARRQQTHDPRCSCFDLDGRCRCSVRDALDGQAPARGKEKNAAVLID